MGRKTGASFGSFSRWLRTGKNKPEAPPNKSLSPSVKLASAASLLYKGNVMKLNNRDDMIIDGEYDAVLVPSVKDDLSESESGELDWSVGWLESFSPEFQSDDENDGSYAVLVPCYRPSCMEGRDGPNATSGNAIKGLSCDYSAEGRKYMEQWLSSLEGR